MTQPIVNAASAAHVSFLKSLSYSGYGFVKPDSAGGVIRVDLSLRRQRKAARQQQRAEQRNWRCGNGERPDNPRNPSRGPMVPKKKESAPSGGA